jgi:hypothetical protein
MSKKKRLSKSTCLHCVYFSAARRKWKSRKDRAGARMDVIISARKIVQHTFTLMTAEEQTQFIKDISTPLPSLDTVLDALKQAFEKVGAKVTEH